MKNAFIYDASIEDKLDGKKTGGDRAEFGGFFDSLRWYRSSGGEPKLPISGRNMHRMRNDGKSIVQLESFPRRFPNRLRANTASGVWQEEASTDRRSLEANKNLTCQGAASSIQG